MIAFQENDFTREEVRLLLDAAWTSIEQGLVHRRLFPIEVSRYPPRLQVDRGVFVTLTVEGHLRGCVGTLDAQSPLIANVAEYAHAAGFADPRFPELTWSEFSLVDVQVSVLSELQPVRFTSESDLLDQLRPGIDGLLLEEQGRRSTFLPAVWKRLPEKRRFLFELKRKAGLPLDHWSASIRFSRYTAVSLLMEPGREVWDRGTMGSS